MKKKMRNQRYNIDDLMMQLREQGVGDIRDVEYAILEPSGKLSVFQKTKKINKIHCSLRFLLLLMEKFNLVIYK